ncbi:MAG: mechanosensitive ion channel family protein [Candidatus Brocadia sp.]|nr:mechanosensitive ion channel family protein [Candidatus Brocadia sp.]
MIQPILNQIQLILNQKYFDNTILDYLISIGIFVSSLILVRIFKIVILKRFKVWAESTKIVTSNFIISTIEKFIIPLFYFSAFYFGLTYLKLDPSVTKIIDSAIVVIITFCILRFITIIINHIISYYWSKKVGVEERITNLAAISTIVNIIIWGFGLVFLLDNLGFKISAVIAGLGIGGVAVAFAAQSVLSDFFSYFIIFFDRPFKIGDFIIVDDKMGVVENVGIKTTRISSLGGEQIVFPNSNLTNARIHNYKKMGKRRVLFKIGVTYQTPLQKLKEIPVIVKQIIESINDTIFDRVHFQSYGDFSLIFEVVYYVIGPDYNKYMDIQQEINFRIYEEFESREIKMAHPTQTVSMSGNVVIDTGKDKELIREKSLCKKADI